VRLNCCGAVRPNIKECHSNLLTECFLLISQLTYPSMLNLEAVCSSETLVHLYQTSCHFPACFLVFSYWTYSFTLKTEALYFSDTSVDICPTSQRHIPEDDTFHNFCLLTASCWFLALLTLQLRKWRQYVPMNSRLTFTTLHGVKCQNIALFRSQIIVFLEIYYACPVHHSKVMPRKAAYGMQCCFQIQFKDYSMNSQPF
jgi:hypothetical protein